MAPSTPSGKRVGASDKYSRETIHITVGRARNSYHIHFYQLDRTAFFEVHGRPNATLKDRAQLSDTGGSADTEKTVSPVTVKEEEEHGHGRADEDELESNRTPSAAVYHLEGSAYHAPAFDIVCDWLYNVPPIPPPGRTECRNLLRAYVLALRYEIVDLQDALVDCLRKHHRTWNIEFEDLTWFSNRVGDQKARTTPLLKYMVEQVAWEVSEHSFATFAAGNPSFRTFLTTGDRPIRTMLFEALAEISRPQTKRVEPAVGPNKWRVKDWPLQEDSTQPDQEIIDLDD